VSSLKSSFITVHGVGLKFSICQCALKPLVSSDNTSQLHLLQINYVFLIHQACYSCFWLCRKFSFQLQPNIFFSTVYYFNHSYEMYMFFCSNEHIVMAWHQSMWLDRILYILLVIKPLIVIMCFHVYYLFL